MAYYPLQVEKMLDRYEALVRELGEARVRGMIDAEELGILDEFLRRTAAPCGGARARARRPARRRTSSPGPRLGRRHARLSQAAAGLAGVPAEPRRGGQGARGRHLVRREPESGRSDPGRVRSRQGDGVHARRRIAHRAAGADRAGRRRHRRRTSPTRRSTRDVSARRQEEVLQGLHARSATATARFALDAGRRTASSPRTTHDGRFVTYYGDNHPRYAGNVVKAMASAKDGYPHVVALFADELRGARSGAAAAARRGVAVAGRDGSTTSCWRASSASCG